MTKPDPKPDAHRKDPDASPGRLYSEAEISAAVDAGVLRVLAQLGVGATTLGRPQMTHDERVTAARDENRRPAEPIDWVPCVSRVEFGGTGARFLAGVERRHESGGKIVPERVIRLHRYTFPEGYDEPASETNPLGLPDGYAGARRADGQFTALVKVYIYERFSRADSLALIGKPLNVTYRMTDAEVLTWPLGNPPVDGVGGTGKAE